MLHRIYPGARMVCSRTAWFGPMVAIRGYWNRDRVEHHMESPPSQLVTDSIDSCLDNKYLHLLEVGAISSGEDGLPRFLFEWISHAYVTIDPARQAVCLRLA